jgi:hypothetical protein
VKEEAMEIAEIAQQAADILDAHGWCKGSLENEEGAHCLAGAVNMAKYGDWEWHGLYLPGLGPDSEPEYRALAKVIAEQFPERVWGAGDDAWLAFAAREYPANVVVRFNNHEDTTEDDIRLVLGKLTAG